MKPNRWFVVFGAILIQISLGAIYIYSVFKPALKAHFPTWSATDLAMPAQIVLAVFALSMIISGKINDKIGPRKTAIGGASFLLLGMYVAAKAQTLAQFMLGFGVLGGIGIGAAYVCPIATCLKWFPDKRGLITGLAVAGFGAGGLIFAPLASYLIGRIGIMATIFYLGLIYFVAIILGSLLMKVPQTGYCPAGWTPPAAQKNNIDFSPRQIIKNKKFGLIWITYFIGCLAGLMVIMNISNIWQSINFSFLIKSGHMVSEEDFAAAAGAGVFAVMIASLLNSLGRIIWGKISDTRGREKTLIANFALCGVSLIILIGLTQFWSFIAAISVIGFCFGGFLALYPAITADYFGTKNIGANYGLMFTAYGAGGLLGPWLAPILFSNVQDISYETTAGAVKTVEIGSYSTALLAAAILCFFAVFLVILILRGNKKRLI